MRSPKHPFTRREFGRLLSSSALAFSLPRLFAARGRGPISFQNVAPACGLDFVLRNDAKGRKYQVETLVGGLGVIDFDHDGWPDLYCVNGASLPSLQKSDPTFFNRLYRNNRDGTFTDVTIKAGVRGHGYEMGVAVADYNNDGLEDLYVLGVHGNILYRNNGDGTFTDVTQAAGVAGLSPQGRPVWSVAAGWVDYDNDGHLDLVVSNYCDWTAGDDPICGGLDPKASENMKQVFKDEVEWSPDPVHAAVGADAVALLTDWPQYSTLPFRKIAATMNQPIIFDGRNCLHRDVMREAGFQYYPMGRPAVENSLRLKHKV